MNFRQRCSYPGGSLYKRLDDVRLVLQIHDELVYEVRESILPTVSLIIKDCMEGAIDLGNVKLDVKLSVGERWGNVVQVTEEEIEVWRRKEKEKEREREREMGGGIEGGRECGGGIVNNRQPLERAIFGKEEEDDDDNDVEDKGDK